MDNGRFLNIDRLNQSPNAKHALHNCYSQLCNANTYKEWDILMRRILFYTAIIASISFDTGCATQQLFKYSPTESKALNLARAAGIDAELKDTEAPKNNTDTFTDSPGFALAYTWSGYQAPVGNLSPASSATLNLFSAVLSPSSPSSRLSVFGWSEYRGTEMDAIERMQSALSVATMEYLQTKGLDGESSVVKNDKQLGLSFEIVDEENGCPKNNCFVIYIINKPELVANTSTEMCNYENGCWFYDPSDTVRSEFQIRYRDGETPKLNEYEILSGISLHLPEWIFFYIAPNKVHVNNDDKIRIPLILSKNGPLYFVKP